MQNLTCLFDDGFQVEDLRFRSLLLHLDLLDLDQHLKAGLAGDHKQHHGQIDYVPNRSWKSKFSYCLAALELIIARIRGPFNKTTL